MVKHIEISASILACNPLTIGSCTKEVEIAGADIIHVDIIDGHYVNKNKCSKVCSKIRTGNAIK